MREVVRPRWAAWLRSVLAESSISPTRLANAILKREHLEIRGKSDLSPRAAVRKWVKGSSQPTAPTAYKVGESLRELGVPWCSGPVALHAAGYLSAFVDFIAALAGDRPRTACQLVIAIAASAADLEPFSAGQRRTLAVIRSARGAEEDRGMERELLASIYNSNAFENAWARAKGTHTTRANRRNAAPDIRVAHLYSETDAFEMSERDARVVVALLEWVYYCDPDIMDDYRGLAGIIAQRRAYGELISRGARVGYERVVARAEEQARLLRSIVGNSRGGGPFSDRTAAATPARYVGELGGQYRPSKIATTEELQARFDADDARLSEPAVVTTEKKAAI